MKPGDTFGCYQRVGDEEAEIGPAALVPRRPPAPRDSDRSKRVGLVRVICGSCAANTNEYPIRHAKWCPELEVGMFRRKRQRADLPVKFGAEPNWRKA